MKLKIISWNVRGLNNPEKRLVVKNLLRDWKCDAICLLETKLGVMSRSLVGSLWNFPYLDWVALDADYTSGGILVMWDRRVLEKVEDMMWLYSVSIRWWRVVEGFEWACSRVYGPNEDSLRSLLWDE
ncbi:hypothetical protein ACB092_10G005900 [Castanea dentata]